MWPTLETAGQEAKLGRRGHAHKQDTADGDFARQDDDPGLI